MNSPQYGWLHTLQCNIGTWWGLLRAGIPEAKFLPPRGFTVPRASQFPTGTSASGQERKKEKVCEGSCVACVGIGPLSSSPAVLGLDVESLSAKGSCGPAQRQNRPNKACRTLLIQEREHVHT